MFAPITPSGEMSLAFCISFLKAALLFSMLFFVVLSKKPNPTAAIIPAPPAFATAPALIIDGVFMFKSVKAIDFDKFQDSIPAFLTMVLMPLTYSISNGIALAFIAYALIQLFTGKFAKTSPAIWVIAALSVLSFYIA